MTRHGDQHQKVSPGRCSGFFGLLRKQRPMFSSFSKILGTALLSLVLTGENGEPSAKALIARHEKEQAPVWADGDKATFFFRGDDEQVTLMVGGERHQLRRLPESDVWTLTLERR